MTDPQLIMKIALRAVDLYKRLGYDAPRASFIAAEIAMVHETIIPLRLKEFSEADDSNFAHDVGGIHRHLELHGDKPKLGGCFLPRFAKV